MSGVYEKHFEGGDTSVVMMGSKGSWKHAKQTTPSSMTGPSGDNTFPTGKLCVVEMVSYHLKKSKWLFSISWK